MLSLRSPYSFLPILLCIVTFGFLFRRLGTPAAPPPPPPPEIKELRYKAEGKPPPPPLPEFFPLAANAQSPADLPPIPSWNKPPSPHVPEKTRLYIGFTRYWPLLQQVVLSYITGGWPPEDIYIVENTGTFDANRYGRLSSQNPFFLNYTRLTQVYGVNVITMPSLQTFAQLQNFYLSEAIHHGLQYYFWGHMDVMLLPHEDKTPYKSIYEIAVDTIRESMTPDFGIDEATGEKKTWAIRFFAYDWFALVNAEAFQKIGGWDSMVGYYGTDCDMHGRISMNNMITPIADAADVWDVSDSVEDLEILYRRVKKDGTSTPKRAIEERADASTSDTDSDRDPRKNDTAFGPGLSSTPPSSPGSTPPELQSYLSSTTPDERGSATYFSLKEKFEKMQTAKREDKFRNSWQLKQRGGQGEPYYYDADGWETALQMTVDAGMKINEEKWGHRGCDLSKVRKQGDQWRVEHDWE